MSSDAQIEANRLNAQKSSGPTSPEGKAKTRFNSLKSGIYTKSEVLPGEDPAELESLAGDYREEYHPHTPTQMLLVDGLISGDWLLRRLRQSEARLWQQAMEGGADLGQAYQSNPALDRVMRRIEGIKRGYHRDLRRLEEILEKEAQAAAAQAQAEAAEAKAAAEEAHRELVRRLLSCKREDGTPSFTSEADAEFNARWIEKQCSRVDLDMGEEDDAELDELNEGEEGDAGEGRELGSFRPGEEDSVNELDPGDKEPK